MSAAVIGGGENCEELATGKAFEAVHHTFVGSQNKFSFVVLEEQLYSIGSELDDVSSSVWIADEVGLNSEFTVTVSWVRPKNIDDKLLFWR